MPFYYVTYLLNVNSMWPTFRKGRPHTKPAPFLVQLIVDILKFMLIKPIGDDFTAINFLNFFC